MDEVLSQSEVDALLSAVSEDSNDSSSSAKQDNVVEYNLANQDRIVRGRLPTLDIIHDRFIRMFRVSLSNALRKTANVSVSSTGPIKFSEFMNSLPLPSCINILRLEPLRGAALMVVESKLLYALVDSFFGGSDSPYTKIEGKEFTQIEIKIARKIVLSALADLEKAWKPVYPLTISYNRTEVNPQFVAVVPPSDIVIATTFDVELEKINGTIKLVMPYSSLEPIKSKLSLGFQSEQLEVDHTWINRVKQQIIATKVNIVVRLGEASITIDDIANLEVGDVIQLDHDASQPLNLLVEGVQKLKCVPGTLKGQRAVKIIEDMPS